MAILTPTDPKVLAITVADSLVVAADLDARAASRVYWEWSRAWIRPVVDAIGRAPEPIRSLASDLLVVPTDQVRYALLRQALVADASGPRVMAELYDLAWQAECNSRLGFHVGSQYHVSDVSVSLADLTSRELGKTLPADARPPVLVVVPFRDSEPDADRLRNLLACLLSLREQSFPREQYAVTVVETDTIPRWQEVVTRYADHYLFAPKPGPFNRSWAVNAGVVNTPTPSEVICIMDADVLPDRDFIARNVERFQKPGMGGHLPYRDIFYMDEGSTAYAIDRRVRRNDATVDRDRLRGFLVRRPPGCCIWVRAEAFLRIGGMDERFEGWGGEDNDFAHRYDIDSPLDSYDDLLLHMHHPLAPRLRNKNGDVLNATIPPLSWRPTDPIGRLDLFTG